MLFFLLFFSFSFLYSSVGCSIVQLGKSETLPNSNYSAEGAQSAYCVWMRVQSMCAALDFCFCFHVTTGVDRWIEEYMCFCLCPTGPCMDANLSLLLFSCVSPHLLWTHLFWRNYYLLCVCAPINWLPTANYRHRNHMCALCTGKPQQQSDWIDFRFSKAPITAHA